MEQPATPLPPRLSNGKKIILAFVEDSEHGSEVITMPGLSMLQAVMILQSQAAQYQAQWCSKIEEELQAMKAPATLIAPNGARLA